MKEKCYCHTGEKPGSGCYSCTNCGTNLNLGTQDKCPPCSKCGNTDFKMNECIN